MTPEQRQSLKQACGRLLANNGILPASAKGKATIHVFWVGALRMEEAAGGKTDPWVQVCILSGRTGELVEMPA